MYDLIARLEKLNGPDRGTDADIALAVGPWTERHGLPEGGWVSKGPHHAVVAAPEFTKSIDVAMTLLPEGAEFQVGSANLLRKYWAAVITTTQEARAINCATPAIALSSAALRARKALTGGERK